MHDQSDQRLGRVDGIARCLLRRGSDRRGRLHIVSERSYPYYRTSAAEDRVRIRQWKGEPITGEDGIWEERNGLLDWGLIPSMRRDTHVLRAMLRRFGMIDHPDAIWSDEQALEVARKTREFRKERAKTQVQLTRVLAAMAGAG